MAAVTSLGNTWNTTAGNKTVTATPAVGDLIVVVHGMSGQAGADDSVITDDNSGGTYTKYNAAPLSSGGGTQGALWISVRDSLIASATSTIFTATNSGDTGGGLTVLKVTGMTYAGAQAVRQVTGESSQTENPPSIDFSTNTLTGNPIILGCFAEDNPAGITPPTGFTEHTDTGWATPTSGVEVCSVDSGQTSSSYGWTGGAATDHNEVGIELHAGGVNNPIPRSNAAMLGTITSVAAMFTAVPLFAATLITMPVVAPEYVATHPARTIAGHTLTLTTWPQPAWDAQVRPKLPVEITAVPINDPPWTQHKYAGEWPAATWESQVRPHGIFEAAGVVDPPSTQFKYRGEWPQATWDSQTRPKLPVEITAVPVHDPPFSQRKIITSELLTWDVQTRPHFIFETVTSTDNPPVRQPGRDAVLAAHYAPPVVEPLWSASLTIPGPAPVDDPPFGSTRTRALQAVERAWLPRQLTAISLSRYAESVDNPPFAQSKYRGEWPTLTWGAQTTKKLVPVVVAAPDTPPILSIKYRGEWPQATWNFQTRPKLPVEITAVPVHTPPFSQQKYRGEWPSQTWDAQARPRLLQQADSVQNPPFSQRKYTGEWPTLTWDTQISRKLFQVIVDAPDSPPLIDRTTLQIIAQWPVHSWPMPRPTRLVPQSVDNPPLKGTWLSGVLRQWEPVPSILVTRRLMSPDLAAVPVHDPPPHQRRLYQTICSTWQAPQWPTQSRGPVTADGTIPAVKMIAVSLLVSTETERMIAAAADHVIRLTVASTIELESEV